MAGARELLVMAMILTLPASTWGRTIAYAPM
jgi:hypothetical protein